MSLQVRQSYQKIRAQLVGLTVEIEEKTNVFNILNKKIESERIALGRVESEISDEYQNLLDKQGAAHQEEIDRLMKSTSNLMIEKKKLLQECQEIADKLKNEKEEFHSEKRKLYQEIEDATEQSRKEYKSGYEDRLEKYLINKAIEYKETTARALQPEVNRLQQMHDNEMADIQSKYRSEERKLRDEYNGRLTERIEIERKDILTSQRSAVVDRMDMINIELEAAEREHRYRYNALREDLEKDLDKMKAALNRKNESERKDGLLQVTQAQDNCKNHIKSVRDVHVAEIMRLQVDHDDKLKSMRKQSAENKAAIDERIKAEEEDYDRLHRRIGTTATAAASTVEEDKIMKEVNSDRDKRIQAEIRSMQAESIKLERAWKLQAEKDKHEISEMRSREEREVTRRQKHLNDDIAEYISSREQTSHELRILTSELSKIEEETAAVLKEIEVYSSGISAHRTRMRDGMGLYQMKERDEVETTDKRVAEIRSICERMSQQMREKNDAFDRQLKEIQEEHQHELERLNEQVKADVTRKDDDIEVLRDAVHTEKIKINKLEKLLKQYTTNTTRA